MAPRPSRLRASLRISRPEAFAPLTAPQSAAGETFTTRGWQVQAWDAYDLVPEAHSTTAFIAACLARIRFKVGWLGDDDEPGDVFDEKGEVKEGIPAAGAEVARALVRTLRAKRGGPARLLAKMGANLAHVGDVYLVPRELNGRRYFDAYSIDELRPQADGTWIRYGGPGRQAEVFKKTPDGKVPLVIRVHREHPRFCADDQTEILTSTGWVTHDRLDVGDEVLTLNHVTGLSEWQPVERVNRFDVEDEPMLAIEGRGHSSLTTMDHRWPVIHQGRKPLRRERAWTTSAEMNTNDRILTGAPCGDLPTEAKWSDAMVELVAWFWTEGNIAQRHKSAQVTVCQSDGANPAKVARIRRALLALFGSASTERMSTGKGPLAPPMWREYREPNRPMVIFALNTAASAVLLDVAPGKVVTREFVRQLTASQLELFISTSIDADGHRSELLQNCPERLDAFELACVLSGRSPRSRVRDTTYRDQPYRMWEVAACRATDWAPRTTNRPTVQSYSGIVWCPTTANRTWMARRNGYVHFTGNSEWADSSVRALLGTLEVMALLTQETRSSTVSRIMGPGILWVSEDADLPPDPNDPNKEGLTAQLATVASVAIREPGSAAAQVPVIVRVPGKPREMFEHTQFAAENRDTIAKRDAAVQTFARGAELPPEQVMGMSNANHWGAWMIDETTAKIYIAPLMEVLCGIVTDDYLLPSLAKGGKLPPDFENFVVHYDDAALVVHPDRSAAAQDAHGTSAEPNLCISDQAYRDARGFAESDAPDPEEVERRIKIAERLRRSAARPTTGSEKGPGDVEPGPPASSAGAEANGSAPPGGAASTGASVSPDNAVAAEMLTRISAAVEVAAERAVDRLGARLRSAANAKLAPADVARLTGKPARDVPLVLGSAVAASLIPPDQHFVGDFEALQRTVKRWMNGSPGADKAAARVTVAAEALARALAVTPEARLEAASLAACIWET